jgi:hypothetical protein
MNPRFLIRFFKTFPGRFLGGLLLGGTVLVILRGCAPRQPGSSERDQDSVSRGRTSESQTASITPLPDPAIAKPPVVAGARTAPAPAGLPASLSLYSAPASDLTDAEFGPDYLPFGRLIRCVLVITVDSANIATPVVGLVTEDVCRDGRVIIPVGTEVHGRAQSERARDRISSDSAWVIVWPTGEELPVTGLALDQARDATGAQITDGSAGIRGQFMKADHYGELKLFAATFLSGATDILQDRQPSLLGLQVLPKTRNAALGGAHEVVDTWSRQLAETILQESHFVRCAAGKPWYLYVTQAIDRSKATRAGSRLHPDVRRLQSTEGRASDLTISPSTQRSFTPVSLNQKNP